VTDRSIVRLVNQVVDRLAARAQLSAVAEELRRELRATPRSGPRIEPFLVGESDYRVPCQKCVAPGYDGVETIDFYCTTAELAFQCLPISGSEDYQCGPGFVFECNVTSAYSQCATVDEDGNYSCAQGTEHECDANQGGMFGCPGDENTFVCGSFNCQGDDHKGKYECQANVDFICTGVEGLRPYVCDSEFDCSSGHGFYCLDAYNCVDDFECKSDGRTPCNDDNYEYSDGSSANVPGDFLCGYPGASSDDFTCRTTFSCSGKDEFRCAQTTQFDCGEVGVFTRGTGADSGGFQCKGVFGCQGVAGTDVVCQPIAQFASCNSPTPYSCIQPAFECPSPFNCPDASAYNCNSPDPHNCNVPSPFTCNSEGQIPDHGCPYPFGRPPEHDA
jgi:hypothetical protein